MVVTNNDITQKSYKKLSIQVSLGGLSFCVFDTITHQILTFNSTTFNNKEILDGQLWKSFTQFPILSNSYDEIVVLHDNNLNTFVPLPFFNKNDLGSYLQYNVKVFETDFFTFDEIENNEMNNVYVPFVHINNFFIDQYKGFEYKNVNSILVKKLLDISKNIEEKLVFVHFKETHFEIIVLKNQQLLLFNSFEHQTPEDFIYYVLFTFEQLQLNPEIVNFQLFGTISTESEYFKIAYKFIRNCAILDVSGYAKSLNVPTEAMKEHFILFHS